MNKMNIRQNPIILSPIQGFNVVKKNYIIIKSRIKYNFIIFSLVFLTLNFTIKIFFIQKYKLFLLFYHQFYHKIILHYFHRDNVILFFSRIGSSYFIYRFFTKPHISIFWEYVKRVDIYNRFSINF